MEAQSLYQIANRMVIAENFKGIIMDLVYHNNETFNKEKL